MTVQPQSARLRPFRPVPFGRYTLLTPLSMGGMGEIFLARLEGAQGFQKLCVIKKILPQLARDPEFVERFVNEARILVKLSHGSIAQVLDVGLHEDDPYIALEYVDGKDLRKIAARARDRNMPLPLTLVLYVMGRVLDALAYAHRKRDDEEREIGLVHRDVSPQNILVSYEGEVKVIDFGLAKSSLSSAKTNPSMILGKFLYMSPEQARHQKVDRRSDLYSVGLCLYELISGRNPFDDVAPHELMMKVANPVIAPIHTIDPLCPAPVQEIVARALEFDPAKRFQTAEEFRSRIQACLWEIDPSAGPESVARYLREAFSAEYQQERRLLASLRSLARPAEGAAEVKSNKSREPITAVSHLEDVAPSQEAARALTQAPSMSRPVVEGPIQPAPLSFVPTPRTRMDEGEPPNDGETAPGVIVTEELRKATLPQTHATTLRLVAPREDRAGGATPGADPELSLAPEELGAEPPTVEVDLDGTEPRVVLDGAADTQPRVVVGMLLDDAPVLPPPQGRLRAPTQPAAPVASEERGARREVERTGPLSARKVNGALTQRRTISNDRTEAAAELITGPSTTAETHLQEIAPRGRSRALVWVTVLFVGATVAAGGWFAWDVARRSERFSGAAGDGANVPGGLAPSPRGLPAATPVPREEAQTRTVTPPGAPAPPRLPTLAVEAIDAGPSADLDDAGAGSQLADAASDAGTERAGDSDLVEALTPPRSRPKRVRSPEVRELEIEWSDTQRAYRAMEREHPCDSRQMRMVCSRYDFLDGEMSNLDDDDPRRVQQLRTAVRRLRDDLRALAKKGR